MFILYSKKEFENAKCFDNLLLKCLQCESPFYREKTDIQTALKGKKVLDFCSRECCDLNKITKKEVPCKNCGKNFLKTPSQIKRSKNHFCSRSCAATYNNLHKKHGTRRSKLEKWIEEQLTILYPDLEIHFNKKEAINSELDIFIPSLKLAFELNGIYHYEPIHGQKKLDQIKNNDHRKYAACIERDIELCLIDTSMQKYVKPKTSQKFLDIVTSILDSKLNF